MKVLVLGSIVRRPRPGSEGREAFEVTESSSSTRSDEDMEAAYKAACRSIGVQLASAGHEVVVSSDGRAFADPYVIEGVCAAPAREDGRPYRVWVLRPDDDSPFPFQENSVSHVEILRKRMPVKNFRVARFYQVEATDAVISIGGRDGASSVGQIALAHGKPVIGIPHFEGSGKDLWKAIATHVSALDEVHDKLVTSLESHWPIDPALSDAHAKTVVESLERFAKSGVFRRDQRRAIAQQSIILGLEVVMLLSWFAIFSYISVNYPRSESREIGDSTPPVAPAATLTEEPPTEEKRRAASAEPSPLEKFLGVKSPIWIFVLSLLAAMIAVLLRHCLRAVFDPTTRLAALRIVTDAASGLVLAFILCLMFLIGAITVTGSTVSTMTPTGVSDFERIAIVMSLLGVTGGFLVEQAADTVRLWLLDQVPRKRAAA